MPATPTMQGTPAKTSDLKEKINDDLSSVQNSIKAGADTAVEKAKDAVSSQKNYLARQVGGIANALQKVGSELENSDQSDTGRYVRQIGRSVQGVARQMENRDLGELATFAEDFGRKQPVAFLGVAALAGLAASRFLTASAKRSTNIGSNRSQPERRADHIKSEDNTDV
ncbi:hypothetical protein [Rhizobium grahamii]|uniref:Nutrient deprivation-induced protein n=2 Tax=Rhizobium grahamii TaxID=1120045 RepID=S3IBA1_9HYPH|nr:hypothetical protein [Rhizobium grahamii]EPE96513.1 nutrient deprivation-induced protein [Rhizobium grahamii CCGE 502]RDJ03307.1 nutrient deprivation-induced protein [Rhizobium grahamii]